MINIGLVKLILLPILLNTGLIYFLSLFFPNNEVVIGICFLIGISAFFVYVKLFEKQFKFKKITNLFHELIILPVIVLIFLQAIVLSPLLLTKNNADSTQLRFPGIGDYFKHTYVLTAINNGLPLKHPYFPDSKFSYYYGYYLLPAATAKLLNINQTTVLFIYVLFTTFISFAIFIAVINEYIKKLSVKLITILFLCFGYGMDIIPTLLTPSLSFTKHIELWSQQANLEFIVNNLYTASLWVPQHFLAAAVLLFLIIILNKGEKNVIYIFLCISYIFLSSVFVSMLSIFWLFIVFILKSDIRKHLLLVGGLSFAYLYPYLISLTGRGGFLYFYTPKFFPFIQTEFFFLDLVINYFLTFISEYGLLIIILPVLLIFNRYKLNWFNLFLIGVFIFPFLLTWFVRSPTYNDFGMRFILPLQIMLVIVLGMMLDRLKRRIVFIMVFFVLGINLMLSSIGFVYEYANRFKERKVIGISNSEMLLKIRELDSRVKLATFETGEWVFYIPVLGFKQIYSPSLFDSGVYIAGEDGGRHSVFEKDANQKFNNPITGKDQNEVITIRNDRFKKIKVFFDEYFFDQLIIYNKIWIRNGINPWFTVFEAMDIPKQDIAKEFSIYKRDDLINNIKMFDLFVDQEPEIKNVIDNNLFLDKGLWFVVSCTEDGNKTVKLDFENYYSLYESSFYDNGCVGAMFVHPEAGILQTGQNTTEKRLYIYKIVLKEVK